MTIGGYIGRSLKMLRANQWWEFKLIPALVIVYGSAIKVDVPITSMWSPILVLLIALGSGAAFVSLLNDATDRADDASVGKPNRLADRSDGFIASVLAVPILVGVGIGMWWSPDPALLCAYLGAWIAFILYSVPPMRLKGRGIWGLLADSAGAHMFPALMAALVVFNAAREPVDLVWLAAVACWSMAYGVRGILWHQLTDVENDRAAKLRTFVVVNSPRRAVMLARYLIFPIECCTLFVLLWWMGVAVPFVALGAYFVLAIGRIVYFQMRPVIVATEPRYLIVFQEFYGVLLPLALLVVGAMNSPADVFALVVHFVLFPRAILTTAFDIVRIVVRCYRGHRLR